MATQKTLYILRHAKTETGSLQQSDASRQLVERGEKAAQILGAYLFRHEIRPDKVICSDAVRTRQTLQQIESVYPNKLNVEFSAKAYQASANELICLLNTLPDPVKSVMILAHNPGVHQLALKFAHQGDEKLLDILHMKYPTCALATLSLGEVLWSDVGSAKGILTDLVTPQMLAGIGDD